MPISRRRRRKIELLCLNWRVVPGFVFVFGCVWRAFDMCAGTSGSVTGPNLYASTFWQVEEDWGWSSRSSRQVPVCEWSRSIETIRVASWFVCVFVLLFLWFLDIYTFWIFRRVLHALEKRENTHSRIFREDPVVRSQHDFWPLRLVPFQELHLFELFLWVLRELRSHLLRSKESAFVPRICAISDRSKSKLVFFFCIRSLTRWRLRC